MKDTVQPKHRKICRRLLESGMLPRSACGSSLPRVLKPLFDSGVLRWGKSGGGQRLVVANRQGFQRWFEHYFPAAHLAQNVGSSRVRGVAEFRDSKALRSNLPEVICLRSIRDGSLLRDGISVPTTGPTKEYGVFSFTLADSTPYTLRGDCALIENVAVFHSFEELGLNAPLAIHVHSSSKRFLNWLVSNVERGLRVLHLPDYDPFGLTHFLRLHRRLGEAVTLHEPTNLAVLFRNYSKSALLRKPKNQRMLLKLRQAPNPSVRRVVALIDDFNAGQEHEALLINTSR